MAVTDETINKMLTTMNETVAELTRMHKETNEFNKQIINMMMGRIPTATGLNQGETKKKEETKKKDEEAKKKLKDEGEDAPPLEDEETTDVEDDSTVKEEQFPDTPFFQRNAPPQWMFGGQNDRPNLPKPIRPRIDMGADDLTWQLFLDRWNRYKLNAKLFDQQQICLELRNACEDPVDKALFEFVGTNRLNSSSLTEYDLLKYIKGVAVRSVHTDVHRWQFNQMTQQVGEPIAKFVGRLKAQALECNFNVTCCNADCKQRVSYADEMVSQQLTSGAANQEHQTRLLSEAKTVNTLQKKVEKMMSFEVAETACSQLRVPTGSTSAPMKSNVSRSPKPANRGRSPRMERGRSRFREGRVGKPRCRGCGRTSHPNGKSLARKDCPAFGEACSNCGRDNHFARVCNDERKPKQHRDFSPRTRSAYLRSDDEEECDDVMYYSDADASCCSDSQYEAENEEDVSRHLAARVPGFRHRRCHGMRR